ncbi:MAG: FecCD family ABC transporter permease [Candidatus Aminicenantales bacterium]
MTAPTKRGLLLAALIVLMAAGFLASLLIGPVRTTAGDLVDIITGRSREFTAIFLELRLARVVLAFLVGAALSLSGAILQGYFQNSMADPFVVGASSGASLGAVVCIAFGINITFFGFSSLSVFAFAGGFGIVSLVYLIARRKANFRMETLLLTGIAAGAMASALTSFFLFMKADSFEQAVFWLLGSFALADWKQVAAVGPYVLLSLAAAQGFSKDMNLLAMGDETAQSLGCPVVRVRRLFLALATLLAALSVSVSGIIGFVGLVVPHWIRILIGPDHRWLFPFSFLAGGVFLVLSDLLARTILSPAELPIGVITAAVGAPFFIFLLNKKKSD